MIIGAADTVIFNISLVIISMGTKAYCYASSVMFDTDDFYSLMLLCFLMSSMRSYLFYFVATFLYSFSRELMISRNSFVAVGNLLGEWF